MTVEGGGWRVDGGGLTGDGATETTKIKKKAERDERHRQEGQDNMKEGRIT